MHIYIVHLYNITNIIYRKIILNYSLLIDVDKWSSNS